MTKSTFTRERLEKIKSWRETYGAGSNVMLPAEEAEELARIALAVMDSEPVAWLLTDPEFGHSVATRAGYTLNWYRSKGWGITPLYRHAQQPVLPDAAAVYAQLSDHEKWSTSLENVNHVLNACRAAMLAAATQEVNHG